MIETFASFVGLPVQFILISLAVTLFAGFVKGAVGFAMPLIMISAFSSFLPPEHALAGLILPTLITNLSQAFRQGIAAAKDTALEFHRFIIGTVVFILISAQIFEHIPRLAYLLLLGIPVTAFAALQLAGLPLALRLEHRNRAEWALGIVGGLYGGVSGIWGPPLLVYLLSTGVEKQKMIRAQGVIFLIGSIALLSAHLGTGLMADGRLVFSALLVIPAQIGMAIGFRLQDRLPQNRFRKITQALLVVSGLNLVRQALFG
ncbi:sulfite exporter TauE/SafE family protein [Thioclava sp. FR2]|uniref:sulfite exporter TauE/SafE family protein n=1 Tax=Thioclava sp. FR2 TaxID=3445780 RepID=UPI003EBC2E5C